MTLRELVQRLDLSIENEGDLDRELTGGYCGDLLSWVMSKAGEGCVWITIMSNVNVIAVAKLTDVSCVLLAEDVRLDEDARQKAAAQGVNVLVSAEDAFTLAGKLGQLL